MEQQEITVGMKLYRDAASKYNRDAIDEYTVSKIGRKYFKVEEAPQYKIEIDTLEYKSKEYSQHNFSLYANKQTILDCRESDRLFWKIKQYFNSYAAKGTLEQLRAISEILGLTQKETDL